MKPKLLVVAAVVVAAGLVAGGVYLQKQGYLSSSLVKIQELAVKLTDVVRPSIDAPDPLIGKLDRPLGSLSAAGIIEFTNQARVDNSLPPLISNDDLNQAAKLKVDDMFTNQYFAHVSPSGVGPDHWVELSGYDYLNTGENLAMGAFKDDHSLVEAWLASPGHRANILSSKFTEIGVAVRKGNLDGQPVWLAVQVFGRPASACSAPDLVLKDQITIGKSQLELLASQLETRRAEVEAYNPKRGEEYKQMVRDYNNLVNQYNELVAALAGFVEQYNSQVSSFNLCAAG